jgi:hypothetical protein
MDEITAKTSGETNVDNDPPLPSQLIPAASTPTPSSSPRPTLPLRWVIAAILIPAKRLRSLIRTLLLRPIRAIDTVTSPATTMIRRLPIVEFYHYMWLTNKPLFAATIFVNYLMPLLFEAMPWWLSRRKLSRRLRQDRNLITHRVVKVFVHGPPLFGIYLTLKHV